MLKDFDVHFSFQTTIEVELSNEKSITEELESFFTEEIIYELEKVLLCGIDFDREDIKKTICEDGTIKLDLNWSSYWLLEAYNEEEASKITLNILKVKLEPFKQILNEEFSKKNRFKVVFIGDSKVLDILNH